MKTSNLKQRELSSERQYEGPSISTGQTPVQGASIHFLSPTWHFSHKKPAGHGLPLFRLSQGKAFYNTHDEALAN